MHPSLWIVPFLFVVKLEIIKYIGQSSENWLKAGGKVFGNNVILSWSPSALCFVLIHFKGSVVRPHSSPTQWLQEVVSCGSKCSGTSWGMCMTQK